MLCKKFDIILTDYKTNREKTLSIIKGFNLKNFDKGMKIFDDIMNDFDDMMSDFGKELGGGTSTSKRKVPIHINPVQNSNQIRIWGNTKENPVQKKKGRKKRKRKTGNAHDNSKTKSNVEKLIGKKRTPIF